MSDRARGVKDILWILALAGGMAILFRLFFGLGPTTNLSDQIPWGLWKILNMVAGVALSTGGFMVGFLVYVLKIEKLKPLVKPAILIAFLGYGCSGFALLMDIGLPHRFWHPIVMWNEHSFLFEVTWCVMLYFTVTVIELSPTILERFKIQGLAHFLHKIAPGVVIVGIALSSLHHSSLGSLFLVTPQRLYPLWYTGLLPLQFIISAMGAGLMTVVFIKIVYARLYDPESIFGPGAAANRPFLKTTPKEGETPDEGPDMPMVRLLAVIATGIISAYFVLKVADLVRTGALKYLFPPTWEGWLYLGEILTFCIIPIALVAIPATRKSPAMLALASLSAIFGLVLNRVDVGIFGYFRDTGIAYFPTALEWALSIGVVASAGIVFLFACENCAVFDDEWETRLSASKRFNPSFDKFSGVWYRAIRSGTPRVTMLAVLVIPLAWLALYPPFHGGGTLKANPVIPPRAQDSQRNVLKLEGNGTMPVVFNHTALKERLGGEESCAKCHHLSLPNDKSTACYHCHRDMEKATVIFDHTRHQLAVAKSENLTGVLASNRSCPICHEAGQPETRANAKSCMSCHKKDMSPGREVSEKLGLYSACGYRKAMHDTCIKCHREEAVKLDKPGMAECSFCHKSNVDPSASGLEPPLQARNSQDMVGDNKTEM